MTAPAARLICALVAFVSVAACDTGSRSGVHEPRQRGALAEHARLPVGLRRLTNREFRKAASSLLGVDWGPKFETSLPPDVLQEDGYARNVAQSMSGALAIELERVLPELVAAAMQRPGFAPACNGIKENGCVRKWITGLAERAWRRPPTPTETAALERVFDHSSGANGLAANDGATAVVTALLLSPNLWYVRELGEAGEADGIVNLTQYEIADQVSIVIRGTVADESLVSDAKAGKLSDPAVRQGHARRLLALSDTREHYREFVASWLEIDKLGQTSKSPSVFEQYEAFKPRMIAETEHFADAVFMSEGASVASLLGAGFVSVDPQMAVFYGLQAFGERVSSTSVGRLGVLQQASFLASHSHSDTTSPVLRGDFVLRKVLCERLPRPSELDIEVTMPRPRRDMTRREQFALHGADPRCAECHDQIDGFGLVFEEFDAAGRHRDVELGKPVRKDGKVHYGGSEYRFADSGQLVQWLRTREETADCFARQLFRFVSGRVDPGAEAGFLALREELDDRTRDNVLEHLVTYVGSPQFVERRRQ